MIPPLDDRGYLPPGIHLATIDEVVARFGRGSDERVAEGQSLRWLLPMCRRAGIVRLIINGSFTTDVAEPRDVDCLLLVGPDYDEDSDAALALEIGLPYLGLSVVQAKDWQYMTDIMFGTDRQHVPKGIVEVPL